MQSDFSFTSTTIQDLDDKTTMQNMWLANSDRDVSKTGKTVGPMSQPGLSNERKKKETPITRNTIEPIRQEDFC